MQTAAPRPSGTCGKGHGRSARRSASTTKRCPWGGPLGDVVDDSTDLLTRGGLWRNR